MKLLLGALAFIFHRFLENAFSSFPSLSVRGLPRGFSRGAFSLLRSPESFFQPVLISSISDLKSNQEKTLKPKYNYKPGQEAPPPRLLERVGVGATPRKSEKLVLMGGHC